MAENHFTSTIESLFKGMDQFVTTKTVVGEPVQVGETIIIPLIDVTCGMAAGAFAEGSKQKDKGCGGMSAKMSPSAVLVIQNGVTKLVNVKNQAYIIYADSCALSDIDLQKWNITFKKIPRDIEHI